MPILTPSILKAKFESGDRPNGSDFADLIDSLRAKLEMIPAAEVQGLAALISAAVDARVGDLGSTDLQAEIGAAFIRILSSSGAAAVIPAATDTDPGLLLPGEKTTLNDINQIIDDRIAAAGGVGGGGGGGGIGTAVTRTVSGSSSYNAAAETLLSGFLIFPTAVGQAIQIGTAPATGDLFEITPDSSELLALDLQQFSLTTRTIYFTGQFDVRFIVTNYA